MFSNLFKTILAILLILLSWGLFWMSIYSALSDAQGIIMFLFTAPISLLVLTAAFFLFNKTQIKFRRFSLICILFWVCFVGSGLIGPLRFIPHGIISLSGQAFEAATGMTAFAWSRKK